MSETQLAVRCVLVKDSLGVAQCVLTTGSMLDLNSLQTHAQRKFLPMSHLDIVKATRSRQLTLVTGSDSFYLLPTFVDTSLAGKANLVIDAQGGSLGALRDTIHQQGEHDRHLEFALPASQLRYDLPGAGEDSKRIQDSISNFTSLRIKQRLDETLEIPPLSATADRILQLRANPNATVTELTSIVEADPSLAAQVVSWASSPYYAAPGKIRSVQDTIVRVLGFDLVSKRPRQGMMYLARLFNNFGYLILAHSFPPHFTSISREQISAWLMQAWNMPDEVCIALRYQQDSSYEGPHAVYANLIFVAMRLLRRQGIGDAPPETVSAEMFQLLGLDPIRCEDVFQKFAHSTDVRSIADQMAH